MNASNTAEEQALDCGGQKLSLSVHLAQGEIAISEVHESIRSISRFQSKTMKLGMSGSEKQVVVGSAVAQRGLVMLMTGCRISLSLRPESGEQPT